MSHQSAAPKVAAGIHLYTFSELVDYLKAGPDWHELYRLFLRDYESPELAYYFANYPD